ncbi:MAG: T9SS type A sorting domain-containing protein [Flavobacteriales bacterium]|nr:T9SS type A sorting domain-containing protein [Flavobacteriales bacterium]
MDTCGFAAEEEWCNLAHHNYVSIMKKSILICSLIIAGSWIVKGQNCINADYLMQGNANDNTGNGFDGVVNGLTATADENGNPNSAFLFDAVDDNIELNGNAPVITTDEFTISIKARIDGAGGGSDGINPLFSQRDDVTTSGGSIVVIFGDNLANDIAFIVRGGTGSTSDKLLFPAYPYGEWHCYTMTLDGNQMMRMYVDGIEVASMQGSQPSGFTQSVDHVQLGRHSYSGAIERSVLNGAIGAVKIFDCALSLADIAQFGVCASSLTELPEKEIEPNIQITPNPTSGLFTLNIVGVEIINSIVITDILGKVVYSISGEGQTNHIRIIDLISENKGVYFVQVQYETKTAVRKVIYQ